MRPSSHHCADLASPERWNFGVSIFILLGILISYLPQHYRLIARRSSEGISPYFVLLGTTSQTSALANILALPASRADIACCAENSGFACFAGLLGILQIAVQWGCFTIILLLWLAFFPRATPAAPPSPLDSKPSFRTAVIVTGICIVHGLVIGILNIVVLNKSPEHLQAYANTLGLFATLLAAVQYLPQIYTTYNLKTVGSLSIPMMCIQTPGSYVWAASLAARLGWAGWSTWGLFLVTGALQGTVLGMGIYFEVRSRGKKHDVTNGDINGEAREEGASTRRNTEENDERTPLISSER